MEIANIVYDKRAAKSSHQARLLRWSMWFFLVNTAFLLLISTRYLNAIELDNSAWVNAFTFLAFTGHFFSLSCLAFLLLLPMIIFGVRFGWVFVVANLLALSLLVFIGIDSVVFSIYHYHLNTMVFNLLFGGAAGQIFTFSPKLWMVVLVISAVFIFVEVLISWLLWSWIKHPKTQVAALRLVLILGGIFVVENAAYAWAQISGDKQIIQQIHYLPLYRPLPSKSMLLDWGLLEEPSIPRINLNRENLSDVNLSNVNNDTRNTENLSYPTSPLKCRGSKQPLNLLMIVIDTWRFDSLSKNIMPNVNRFANNAWRFSQHYSGGNSTRMGVFSLFYAVPGTYWHSMLNARRAALLVTELQRQKYKMGIFSSASLRSPEFDRSIFSSVENLTTNAQKGRPSDRDKSITGSAKDFIRQMSRQAGNDDNPFFAFLFFDSAHGYDYPDDYALKFQPSWDQVNFLALDNRFEPTVFINRYKNSLHYVDELVGSVIDTLSEEKRLQDTVVIITGDHGQEFNDTGRNYWGHTSNFSHYQVQVPMVVYWPNKGPKVYRHQTSHYDVAPMLMRDLLACNNPISDYSIGKHLLDDQPLSYLILSSYYRLAIMQDSYLTVVDEYDNMKVFDDNYKNSVEYQLSGDIVDRVNADLGRFYKYRDK